jgi:hypothetical protein
VDFVGLTVVDVGVEGWLGTDVGGTFVEVGTSRLGFTPQAINTWSTAIAPIPAKREIRNSLRLILDIFAYSFPGY